MLNKIREEFEKYFDVLEYRLDSDFPVFEAGYTSRDKEIKKLRDVLNDISALVKSTHSNHNNPVYNIAQKALEE